MLYTHIYTHTHAHFTRWTELGVSAKRMTDACTSISGSQPPTVSPLTRLATPVPGDPSLPFQTHPSFMSAQQPLFQEGLPDPH